jgi:hypothetical protein
MDPNSGSVRAPAEQSPFRVQGGRRFPRAGGGKLRLYSIDGIASEGGLIAYLEGDHFLWASDYIQTVSQPSTYATDVWRAVERAGIRPSRVAAEHLPLTEWGIVDSLAQSEIRKETT